MHTSTHTSSPAITHTLAETSNLDGTEFIRTMTVVFLILWYTFFQSLSLSASLSFSFELIFHYCPRRHVYCSPNILVGLFLPHKSSCEYQIEIHTLECTRRHIQTIHVYINYGNGGVGLQPWRKETLDGRKRLTIVTMCNGTTTRSGQMFVHIHNSFVFISTQM